MKCTDLHQNGFHSKGNVDTRLDYFSGFSTPKEEYLDINAITPTLECNEKVFDYVRDITAVHNNSESIPHAAYKMEDFPCTPDLTSFESIKQEQCEEKFEKTFKIVSFLSDQAPLEPAVLKKEDTDIELKLIDEYVEEQLSNEGRWLQNVSPPCVLCNNNCSIESHCRNRTVLHPDLPNSSDNGFFDGKKGNSKDKKEHRYNLRKKVYFLAEKGLVQKYMCQARDSMAHPKAKVVVPCHRHNANRSRRSGSKSKKILKEKVWEITSKLLGNHLYTGNDGKFRFIWDKSTGKDGRLRNLQTSVANMKQKGIFFKTKEIKMENVNCKVRSPSPRTLPFSHKPVAVSADQDEKKSGCKAEREDEQHNKRDIVIRLQKNKFGEFTSRCINSKKSKKPQKNNCRKVQKIKKTRDGHKSKKKTSRRISTLQKSYQNRKSNSQTRVCRKKRLHLKDVKKKPFASVKQETKIRKPKPTSASGYKKKAAIMYFLKDPRFGCSDCTYKTNSKNQIEVHIRRHNGDKPFCCTFCSYRSVERSHVTRHIRVHTGERPHKCPSCMYSSIQKVSLNVHIRRWH